MRFKEQRETLYRGFARLLEERRPDDLPVPVATPRLIRDPQGLAFTPASNRASRRRNLPVTRFKMPAYVKTWGNDA